MNVLPITILADHRPLTITINFKKAIHKTFSENSDQTEMPKRVTFNNTNIFRSEIEKNLNVNEQRKLITEITSCNFSIENEVYKIVEKIQHIFTDTAACTCEPKSRKTLNTNKPKLNHSKTLRPWYKSNCKKLKRQINYLCKKLTKYPTNPYLREKFFALRKNYKSLIKQERRKHEQSLTNTLESLHIFFLISNSIFEFSLELLSFRNQISQKLPYPTYQYFR